MKWFRILAVTLYSLVLVVMLVGCGGPKTVTFPDENLEAAVRDALGKSAGEGITVDELANITTLNASLSGISDLSGLEHCTNLTGLYIWDNQISDISVLASLTNLWFLDLSGNRISDISPLVQNSGLGEGDLVHLEGNNLDSGEGSEDRANIKALQYWGVIVSY